MAPQFLKFFFFYLKSQSKPIADLLSRAVAPETTVSEESLILCYCPTILYLSLKGVAKIDVVLAAQIQEGLLEHQVAQAGRG